MSEVIGDAIATNQRSKVLGQLACAATTAEDMYTVPVDTTAQITNIHICNRTASAVTFRLSVAVAGVVAANKQYLYYDQSIAASSVVVLTDQQIYLGPTDVLRFYASAASLSVNVFGFETPISGYQ
mgnify:CR=1 FL=1